ncbi:exosome component 10 [Cylas formicarius]|uniref:exosome component 10 n=1 Tax=Cylas formicarius TaxID=197179 RepID=UPI002958966E|nr:exosome component 10 [Cylas formicarius]
MLANDNSLASENQEEIVENKSVDDFLREGYQIVQKTLKLSNALPSGKKFNIYMVDSNKAILQTVSDNLLSSMNLVLRKNDIKGSMRNNIIDKKSELLIEACDVILERVTENIDEQNGIKKNNVEPTVFQTVSVQVPINGSWNQFTRPVVSSSSTLSSPHTILPGPTQTIRLVTAESIVKPQKFFKDKIDNSREKPWEPRIKEKPNSIKPLAIFLEETANGQEYSHPYECELDKFSPSDDQLGKSHVIKPKLLRDTPLVEITQEEQLKDLIEDLQNSKEIGVDLEHHSYRTFMGITCLLQISTLEKDYLIDTLVLRDKLFVLNEVFTNPKITKIFHGAQHDIQWLQRDLSLYVVNMFDTYFAAKQLEYPGLSLAYLMQKFCNFAPNKQFQLADWRLRPLPDELKSYAREDTHYLIYIYQKLKNELLDRANGQDNLLKSVIQMSTDLCKTRYLKPIFNEESYLNLYRLCSRMFHNRQLFALQELYRWRDEVSREEDESVGYVLPNNMLLEISERLPREMQGILACCNPTPPLVKANLLRLHKIMLKALEQPVELPILKEDTRSRGMTTNLSKFNINNPLHCPHDLTNKGEVCDNLPTLLGGDKLDLVSIIGPQIEQELSIYSLFNTSEDSNSTARNRFKGVLNFLSPYKRYKMIKPFIQAKEQKVIEENAKNVTASAHERQKLSENDNRTDNERIESIRNHFLELSNKTLEKVPASENKKKRKRTQEDSSALKKRLQENAGSDANTQKPFESKGRKRKSQGDAGDNSKGNKKKRIRKTQKQAENETQNEEKSVGDDNSSATDQVTSGKNSRKAQKRKQYWQNRKKGARRNVKRQDSANQQQFSPYDYSMVDFRQFQGGARGIEQPKAFKSKFKSKGKKRNSGNPNSKKKN